MSCAAAPPIVNKLRAHKVAAFALTESFMASRPAPRLVKRLAPAAGASEPMYLVEFWKGDPAGLRTADIFLLVSASLNSSSVVTETDVGLRLNTRVSAHGIPMNWSDGPAASRTTETKFSHLIDVYLNDGTQLRFNSDRISYDVLGKDRGYTDRENADKLALRLASEAPNAHIDTGFSALRIPPELSRDMVIAVRNRTRHQRDQTAMFDFYSIWSHTVHRGLAGPATAP